MSDDFLRARQPICPAAPLIRASQPAAEFDVPTCRTTSPRPAKPPILAWLLADPPCRAAQPA
ncbi:hypothetical protein ABH935_001002, partial [Catenulispora sp. GAS73]|uniref:hypothetical protein n=1 Tax=Catenulispora sp. GAS73 TaxID=3156269 RepID=UPI003510DA6B